MEWRNVVVAQNDKAVADRLAGRLKQIFPSVRTVRSVSELEATIPRSRADLVVLDLEMADLNEVKKLSHDVSVICTHRVPDEQMWTASMNAGAIDCCQSNDVRGLELTLKRNLRARGMAA